MLQLQTWTSAEKENADEAEKQQPEFSLFHSNILYFFSFAGENFLFTVTFMFTFPFSLSLFSSQQQPLFFLIRRWAYPFYCHFHFHFHFPLFTFTFYFTVTSSILSHSQVSLSLFTFFENKQIVIFRLLPGVSSWYMVAAGTGRICLVCYETFYILSFTFYVLKL